MSSPLQQLFTNVLAPLIAADGGELTLVEVTDKVIRIALSQNCEGCPGQRFTVQDVITPAVRKALNRDVTVEIVSPKKVPTDQGL